jgi:hypothetical protein
MPCASAQGSTGPNVIISLQFAGASEALPQVGSCLASKLSRMPDVEIATGPSDGVRFIVDVVAAKGLFASPVGSGDVSGGAIPRADQGGEGQRCPAGLFRFYTLLRLHERVPSRSRQSLCASIATEISDKVLSKEYTERND